MISRDGALYIRLAEAYMTGDIAKLHLDNSVFPPLLLHVIQWSIKWGIDPKTGAIFFNCLCGLLLIAITYFLCKNIFHSRFWGWSGALVIAFHPKLIELSIEVQREMSYMLFLALLFWAIMPERGRFWNWRWFAGGLFFGLGILCRLEMLEMLVIVPAWLGFMVLKMQIPWQKAVKYGCYWLAGCMILLSCISMSSEVYEHGFWHSYLSKAYKRSIESRAE